MSVCQLTEDLRYHLCTDPVDMRKQIAGLVGIVNGAFGRYPVAGEAFIFIGKNRTMAKILHREGNGITMYVRKLSSGRFARPSVDSDNPRNPTCTIDYRTFAMLVLGGPADLSATFEKDAV